MTPFCDAFGERALYSLYSYLLDADQLRAKR